MSGRRLAVPLIVAALAAVALVIAVVGAGDDRDATDPAGAAAAVDPPADATAEGGPAAADQAWQELLRRTDGDPMALGEVDAPVVMVAYTDLQCPFCGRHHRETHPAIVERYVNTGLLRIEWRDFPYISPQSRTAAAAARAAAEQDAFWDYADAIYADELVPRSGELDDTYLLGVAADLGLDVERFAQDMTSPEVQRAVDADFIEGQAVGVTGTPAFIIDGVPLIGAQPLTAFEQAIEQAAARQGGGF